MNTSDVDPLLVFRIVSIIAFCAVVASGFYLFRNFEKLTGPDPAIPSESSGSRTYGKLQIFLIWIHALILTGMLSLLLH